MSATARARNEAAALSRSIVFRTRGNAHGPITRLVSPSDVGQLIKPFVFLDAFAAMPGSGPQFGWHPHSGIATLTVLLEGQTGYEESTGVKGVLHAGGVEWMRAAGGVWHTGSMDGKERVKGFQLWVALPPELENGAHRKAVTSRPKKCPRTAPHAWCWARAATPAVQYRRRRA